MEEGILIKGYSLRYQWDNENDFKINLWLLDSNYSDSFPVLDITLTPLWDTGKLEDIENAFIVPKRNNSTLYGFGDYYQSAFKRNYQIAPKSNISYGAIAHEIIIENWMKLQFVENIYSTSLIPHGWERDFSPDAKKFWKRQLERGQPFLYFEEDRRYKLVINQP